MRSKPCLLILAMAMLFASCSKDPQPPQGLSFSILGDSFSTFEGYVDPDSNDVWYYERIGVTSVEQMWWYQVSTTMGWTLEKNNSFSGSLICNFWNFNAGPYYKPHSFINRMDNLGNPDVIFIFGGTNDALNGAYSGEFVYSDWTEEDLEFYRPALAYMFDSLKRLYPKARLYFMIDMWLCEYDPFSNTFVQEALGIAHRYNVDCIELYDVHKDWAHPDVQGMADIARQVVDALYESF